MRENKLNIDRGAILYAVAKRHRLSIVKIAKAAGFDKSTFYLHVKRKDLPLETLYKYSVAMDYDFISDVPEMEEYLKKHGLLKENKKMTYQELEIDRDFYKEKYYKLLEEYNTYLKK